MKILKLKKYQHVTAYCQEIVSEGLGLSFLEEDQFEESVGPMTGFVWGVLPGERFVAEVRKITSKCFHAVLLSQEDLQDNFSGHNFAHEKWALYRLSPTRVPERCSRFVACGGCKLLHLNYDETLEYKKEWFMKQLEAHSLHFSEVSVTASPEKYHYRNHVQVHINKHKQRGFYSPMTYRTTPFPEEGCLLFDQSGFDAAFPEELELERCVRGRLDGGRAGISSLYSKEDKQSSFSYELAFPEGETTEVSLPNTAFFQVNSAFIPLWLDKIKSLLERVQASKTIKILELFSGFGFIGKMLSLQIPLQSLGIDILKKDELAKIRIRNENEREVDSFFDHNYIQHDLYQLEKMKPQQIQRIKDFEPDVVLINPPRSGFPPEQINFLLLNLLEKSELPVIYSSCNGATMARDLEAFSRLGYEIKQLELLDFFPLDISLRSAGLFIFFSIELHRSYQFYYLAWHPKLLFYYLTWHPRLLFYRLIPCSYCLFYFLICLFDNPAYSYHSLSRKT